MKSFHAEGPVAVTCQQNKSNAVHPGQNMKAGTLNPTSAMCGGDSEVPLKQNHDDLDLITYL